MDIRGNALLHNEADMNNSSTPPRLSVVLPCYNEEAVLPETASRLDSLLNRLVVENKISASSEVLFVDDGSKDETWAVIEKLCASNPRNRGIRLSKNKGHQAALLAGLFSAEADAVISIDADLQDDVEAICQMVEAYTAGAHVVYGVRLHRDTDTFFKRSSATAYYRLLRLFGVEVVFNHADYRLLSRRAIDALRQYREVNLFLRGIIPQLGFSSAIVYYDRAKRFAGESKYPFRKMLAFAWQGITSFSAAPLHAITALGAIVSGSSFLVAAWALVVRLFTEAAVPGWASTVVPLYFLGGVQLLCIGAIGEYLAKVYMELKQRPRFFIEKSTRPDATDRNYTLVALDYPSDSRVASSIKPD